MKRFHFEPQRTQRTQRARRFRWLLLFVFSVLFVVNFLQPRLHASSMILHQTSFDGGLYWTCPIAGLWLWDGLHIYISAVPKTTRNSFEESANTSWCIDGLETWLVCNEENKLAWRTLMGDTVYFSKDLLSKQNTIESKGRKLTIVSEDEYIVTGVDSIKWVYERGALTRASFANGDELSFKCRNGLIREITHKNKIILTLQQQEVSSLLLFIEGRKIATINYDKTGRLIESITFEDKMRPPVKFSYQNDNLAKITGGDTASHEFVWKKVGFFKRGLSTLLYPHYLYSDGHYTYAHSFYLGNATMTATDMSGNREVKILNLKRGLITDRK